MTRSNLLGRNVSYFLLALLAVAGLAVSTPGHAQQSTLDVVKQRGKLIAGIKTDYPPYGYIDERGQTVGFDIELAKYIAAKLGVAVELFPVTSQNRIPMLQAKSVDLLAASVSVTRKREETVDFSIPYIATGGTFVVKKGAKVKGYADLANQTVAFIQGTPSLESLPKIQPKAKLLILQDKPQAVQAVLQDKAIAFVDDVAPALFFTKQHKQLTTVGVAWEPYPIAIALRENDSKFRDAVNFAILDFFEDGTYAKVYREHFGADPDPSFKVYPWGPKEVAR